jgi:hypothetical protein
MGTAQGDLAKATGGQMEKTSSFSSVEEEPIDRDGPFKQHLKKILGLLVFRQSYLELANVNIAPAERYPTRLHSVDSMRDTRSAL